MEVNGRSLAGFKALILSTRCAGINRMAQEIFL